MSEQPITNTNTGKIHRGIVYDCPDCIIPACMEKAWRDKELDVSNYQVIYLSSDSGCAETNQGVTCKNCLRRKFK